MYNKREKRCLHYKILVRRNDRSYRDLYYRLVLRMDSSFIDIVIYLVVGQFVVALKIVQRILNLSS